jgi:hypothetical protein
MEGEGDFGLTGDGGAGVFYSNGHGEDEVGDDVGKGGELVAHINVVGCGCDVEATKG